MFPGKKIDSHFDCLKRELVQNKKLKKIVIPLNPEKNQDRDLRSVEPRH